MRLNTREEKIRRWYHQNSFLSLFKNAAKLNAFRFLLRCVFNFIFRPRLVKYVAIALDGRIHMCVHRLSTMWHIHFNERTIDRKSQSHAISIRTHIRWTGNCMCAFSLLHPHRLHWEIVFMLLLWLRYHNRRRRRRRLEIETLWGVNLLHREIVIQLRCDWIKLPVFNV